MRIAGKHGMLTMLHAENGDVIDILVAEALAAGHTTPEWHALTRPAWGAVEALLRGGKKLTPHSRGLTFTFKSKRREGAFSAPLYTPILD